MVRTQVLCLAAQACEPRPRVELRLHGLPVPRTIGHDRRGVSSSSMESLNTV